MGQKGEKKDPEFESLGFVFSPHYLSSSRLPTLSQFSPAKNIADVFFTEHPCSRYVYAICTLLFFKKAGLDILSEFLPINYCQSLK